MAQINLLISAKKSARILIGIVLTLGHFEKYTWPLNNTGLSCAGPHICEIFFDKCSTIFLIYDWLNSLTWYLGGLEYIQILVSMAGPGTSVPQILRDDFKAISALFDLPAHECVILLICLDQFLSATFCHFHSISFVLPLNIFLSVKLSWCFCKWNYFLNFIFGLVITSI